MLEMCGKLQSDAVPSLDESIAFVSGLQILSPDLSEMVNVGQKEHNHPADDSSTPNTNEIARQNDGITTSSPREVPRPIPIQYLGMAGPSHIGVGPSNAADNQMHQNLLTQRWNSEAPVSHQIQSMENGTIGTQGNPSNHNVQFATAPNQPPASQIFPISQHSTSSCNYLSTPPHKWKLKFTGSSSDTPIENFIFRIEHLAVKNQISLEQLANEICFLLDGTAKEQYWLTLRCNPNSTWNDIRNSLIHIFQDRRTDYGIKQLIEGRKQKLKEPFSYFYYDILNLSL